MRYVCLFAVFVSDDKKFKNNRENRITRQVGIIPYFLYERKKSLFRWKYGWDIGKIVWFYVHVKRSKSKV